MSPQVHSLLVSYERSLETGNLMQRIATIAAFVLMLYGAAVAGWRGGLTGFIAGAGIGIGAAILIAERGTGVERGNLRMSFAQRAGGLITVIGVLSGSLYGGWSAGWRWALLGFVAGPLVAIVLGATMRAKEGGKAVPTQIDRDGSIVALAKRILQRRSVPPGQHGDDPRYLLWLVAPTLSHIIADEGGWINASQVSGEVPSALEDLLSKSGYDTRRLTDGEKRQRLFYATEASGDLFADVTSKYGASLTSSVIRRVTNQGDG